MTRAQVINNAVDQHKQYLSYIKVVDVEIDDAIQKVRELLEAKRVDTADLTAKMQNAASINEGVNERIREAHEFNRLVAAAKDYSATKEAIKAAQAEYAEYTTKIKTRLGGISNMLTSLGLGDVYEGLELVYEMSEDGKVEREGLFLRGLPFNRRQQSYGEMVKVLILLSQAFNPDGINYAKIGDWNLLDEENAQTILDFAAANDVQLGIEKVDSSKEIVFQIIEK
jgi:hypothetical protein